jgi:hypothetical protein
MTITPAVSAEHLLPSELLLTDHAYVEIGWCSGRRNFPAAKGLDRLDFGMRSVKLNLGQLLAV